MTDRTPHVPQPASAAGPVVPRALFFDVFGTCVDWRGGVAREGEALGRRLGIAGVDWAAVADDWRARYGPQLETVRSGARPWTDLDTLNRESLDDVLEARGLRAVPAAERDELTRAWHRLDPWPDTVPGLTRLRRRYIVAPHSNGHIALLLDMARRAGLPWDVILGAEVARAYKPLPESYLRAVAACGLRPPEVMMVACHPGDLHAAAACGLRTAFVPRPLEHGPGGVPGPAPGPGVDLVAHDLLDLAARLGA